MLTEYTIIGLSLIAYVAGCLIGFFCGKKYEKDSILDGAVGVIADIDKANEDVLAVTYYYSQEAYDHYIKELKENGVDYYEE